jgi:hypothetical protein
MPWHVQPWILLRAETSYCAGVRPPRASVDVSRFGNEPAIDLNGVEHALGVRASLVFSAFSLYHIDHIHCLSHLMGLYQFKVGKMSSCL